MKRGRVFVLAASSSALVAACGAPGVNVTEVVVAPATSAREAGPPAGTVQGVVTLDGPAPPMLAPPKLASFEFCRDTPVVSDAIVVDAEHHLRDVFVRVSLDSRDAEARVRAIKKRPTPVTFRQCMLTPHVGAVLEGGEFMIANGDQALHNPHAFHRKQTWFNQAMPRHVEPLVKETNDDDQTVITLRCDVHPWERAYLMVTSSPLFAITDAAGTFAIRNVPPGRRTVQAWHPRYGWNSAEADLGELGARVDLHFDSGKALPEVDSGD